MKPRDKLASLAEQFLGRQTVDRIRLAKIFFSGELELMRAERVKNGDLPWRILRYARIIDPEKLGYPISKFQYVRPDTFETHLKYLTKRCRVLPLDLLVQMITEKKQIPEKTVAITFDGGWFDNFVYAYPLLLKHQVAATIFLPTAFIDTKNYFWQDKVLFALVIMLQKGVPFLPFDFFTKEELELVRRVSPDGAISLPLVFIVVSILSSHSAPDRFLALSIFGTVAQNLGGDLPAEPAFMTWTNAQMMDATGISFGSLSHAHSSFLEMSNEAIKSDLLTSYEILKTRLKNVSPVFCLPDGLFTTNVLHILQEENVNFALGLHEQQIISADAKPNILPRTAVYEGLTSSTEMFACRIWLGEDALYSGGK